MLSQMSRTFMCLSKPAVCEGGGGEREETNWQACPWCSFLGAKLLHQMQRHECVLPLRGGQKEPAGMADCRYSLWAIIIFDISITHLAMRECRSAATVKSG